VNLELRVNGETVVRDVPAEELLLDFLRNRLDLTGAKRSCDVQVCGACTVLLDGQPVSACCTLAVQAEGRDVLTIEGLAEQPEFVLLEGAFMRHAALQCGFCTGGMLLTVSSLLAAGDLTSADAVRTSLHGTGSVTTVGLIQPSMPPARAAICATSAAWRVQSRA